MKRLIYILFVCVLSARVPAQKAAFVKYGGSFLETGIGARSLALGGAYTAVEGDVLSVYRNPAGLSALQGIQVHMMHSEGFAGMVNRDFIGAARRADNGSCLALGFYRLGVDNIPITRLQDPDRSLGDVYTDDEGRTVINSPYVYKRIDDSESAFSLSYARAVNSRFSFGTSVRIIRKSAGDNSAWGLGFDAGVIIKPLKNTSAGVILRDITSTVIAWQGKSRELIPPSLQAGASHTLYYRDFTVMPVFDISIGFEDRGRNSQFSIWGIDLETHAGCEIRYRNIIAFRAGMDRTSFTAGAGFQLNVIAVDYGFYPHPDLGNTHRISATIHILPKHP